ncbi:MAG: IMPACT family protein [Fibrobacterota bacterium]
MSYEIPKKDTCTAVEIKKSRFIAHLRHVDNPDKIQRIIGALKKKHPRASHVCWAAAWKAPEDSCCHGFSDDKEPTGCAGQPLLKVLSHSGIGQSLIAVVRYFGGTKLGTGGMIKAYTEAAHTVLKRAETHTYTPVQIFSITFPYSLENTLRTTLRAYPVIHAEFFHGICVKAQVHVAYSKADEFVQYMHSRYHKNISLTADEHIL